jgi:hypothetical protein
MIWIAANGRQGSEIVSRLRRGKVTIPPGRWEFQSHGKTCEIFARYLGPPETEPCPNCGLKGHEQPDCPHIVSMTPEEVEFDQNLRSRRIAHEQSA